MSDPAHRIKSHMNKDHQLALVDYVVVYGHEKLEDIYPPSVQILHVTEEELILTYSLKHGERKSVKLEWDLLEDGEGLYVKSMLDIKAKLVAMAKYAAKQQGLSHVQVTKILPPSSALSFVAYAFAALTLATYFKRDFLRSVLGSFFSQTPPALEGFLGFIDRRLFSIARGTYIIHLLEVLLVMRPKTVKYRMPLPTKLAWITFSFFEGYFCIPRLKTLTK